MKTRDNCTSCYKHTHIYSLNECKHCEALFCDHCVEICEKCDEYICITCYYYFSGKCHDCYNRNCNYNYNYDNEILIMDEAVQSYYDYSC